MEDILAMLSGADARFSPGAIFLRADLVVKSVLILLSFMSVWVWAVVFDRGFALSRVRRSARSFLRRLHKSPDLNQFEETARKKWARNPIGAIFLSGMKARRAPALEGVHKAEQVRKAMSVIATRALTDLDRSLPSLATIGVVAPFVGLFGTVWGIMNSFQSIALSRETSLAVVAPGIAEALFATAFGLFAAIPAVVFYNTYTGKLNRYATQLEFFIDEFEALDTSEGAREEEEKED